MNKELEFTSALRKSSATHSFLFSISLLITLPVPAAAIDSFSPTALQLHSFDTSVGDFGGPGLMQMPTGRALPPGELVVSASDIFPYRRYAVTVQALPWMAATFRYTRTSNRPFNAQFRDEPQTDKGLDINIRLMEETDIWPSISTGVRDLGGTQLFSSEYLAATKRFGPLDVTFGLGWGSLARRDIFENPINQIAQREGATATGTFSGNYFLGDDIGLFGGLEYLTPIDGLRLKLEYDSNDYQSEPLDNQFAVDVPVNFGAEYDLTDWITLRGSWQRGNEGFIGAAFRTNFNTFNAVQKTDHPKADIRIRPASTALSGGRGLDIQPNAITVQTALQDGAPALAPPRLPPVAPSDTPLGQSLHAVLLERGIEVVDIWIDGAQAMVEIRPVAVPTHEEVASSAYTIATHPSFVGIQDVFFILQEPNAPIATFSVSQMERSLQLTGTAGAMGPDLSVEWWDAVIRSGAPRIASSDTSNLYSLLEKMQLPTDQVMIEGNTLVVAFAGASSLDATTRSTISDVMQESLQLVGLERVEVRDPNSVAAKSGPWWASNEIDGAAPTSDFAVAKRISADLFQELRENSFNPISIGLKRTTVTIKYSQSRYENAMIGVGRVSRILSRHIPAHIENFRIIEQKQGVDISDITLSRSDLEREQIGKVGPAALEYLADIKSPYETQSEDENTYYNPDAYPTFSWRLSPKIRNSIGGGDEFIATQLYALLSGSVSPTEGFLINGSIGHDLWNNFDNLVDKVDHSNPLMKVRTDLVNYLQGSETWINSLTANYITSLAPDVYARVSGGLYEMMFAGYGGEILYRPTGARWAIGADWNWVHKRDYEGHFGLLDLTQNTGHASLYYHWPWEDISSELSVGRYLAGDIGATLRVSKRFDTGAKVGFWGTRTTISARDFGEGSFDKGFFISFPLGMFISEPSTRHFSVPFAPLTRDGGQRVGIPNSLYGITGNKHNAAPLSGWDDLLN